MINTVVRCLNKGRASGKLTDCEDDSACLVWPLRERFPYKEVQLKKSFAFLWKPSSLPLKAIIKFRLLYFSHSKIVITANCHFQVGKHIYLFISLFILFPINRTECSKYLNNRNSGSRWLTKFNTVVLTSIKTAFLSILSAVRIVLTRVSPSVTHSIQSFPWTGADVGFTGNNTIFM